MKKTLLLPITLLTALGAQAQGFGLDQDNEWKKWRITGAIQKDMLVPQEDESIGTGKAESPILSNTYFQLGAVNKYIEAGARLEFTETPLPGFEKDFKGWGLPFYYIKGNYRGVELTAGTFYEQFGSGLILRTYEERSLGIDNSLRGGRIVIDALKGVRIKALAGQQRRYWDTNPAWVYGADAEVSLHDYFPRMQQSNTAFTLGASWVMKHEGSEDLKQTFTVDQPLYDEDGNPILQPDADGNMQPVTVPETYSHNLRLPENVHAIDLRANLRRGNWNFLAEYAQKSQDPSFDNGYIYRNGRVAMLTGSYSKRGMSFLAQVKRSEDMAFRSRRSMNLTSSFINHLPAFTPQQTYALATIYPYATQNVPGEWAFQAEGAYTFKKKTALGGKYGTTIKATFSHVRAGGTSMASPYTPGTDADYYTILKSDKPALMGTSGAYESNFFKMNTDPDGMFYQEVTVDLEKKLSKSVKLNLKYLNQQYNKTVVEGEGGMIKSNIGIAEVKWNISRKVALRAEAQYLHSTSGEEIAMPVMEKHGNQWVQATDNDGNPRFDRGDHFNAMVPDIIEDYDENGRLIYVQATDGEGNLVYNHEGMDWGKDWFYALVEVSVLPYLMFTVSDQYNPSVYDKSTNSNRHQHYFQGLVTFTKGAHTLRVGYGKTRAGYNCSGGVCRFVPAQKGVTASYTFNF